MNPPKPTSLKKLEGTYRQDRGVKNEVKPSLILGIEPPSDLNEWGSKYWVDVMSEYSKFGIVTKVDVGALHSCCNWYGLMCEAQDIISAKGLEVEIERVSHKGERYTVTETNPMIAVADKAFKNYIAMCREFGLTPSSRSRISAPESKTDDKFADFDN